MLPVAFNGDSNVRTVALDHLKRALEAGKITEGSLAWNGDQGSLAGALAQTGDAALWQQRMGLPKWIANALDAVMRPLNEQDSLQQTTQVLESIRPGQSLETSGGAFVCKLLGEVASEMLPKGAIASSMTDIVELQCRRIRGESIHPSVWRLARAAAGRAMDGEAPAAQAESAPSTPGQSKLREVAMAIEAAAWDPLNSPSSVSDLLRHWFSLESLKADAKFGWTHDDHARTHEHLKEMHETYLTDETEELAAGETAFSLLEKHRPDVFKRLQDYHAHDQEHRVRCAKHACGLLKAIFTGHIAAVHTQRSM